MEHEKALSRHQLMMPLEDLFSISMKILKHSGRLSLIYPASRMDKIQMTMQESGFKPSRVLWIHAWEGAEAGLVCLEARAGAGPIHAAQDSLFVYRAPGLRTRAVETILAGDDIPGCTKGLG
jgi:tRNA1(Val) A37 N6-methylase TrmN6